MKMKSMSCRSRSAFTRLSHISLTCLLIALLPVAGCGKGETSKSGSTGPLTIVNASYDPTRELYAAIDDAFARQWKATHGQDVTFKLSNAGSGKQARAVIDGLPADVVTLALAYDVDAVRTKGELITDANWQLRLPHNSTPFTSTIAFLVRKGNPKQIHDWDDLVDSGKAVQIVVADPRTSGGARWAYLAAWGQALRKHNVEADAREFVSRLYKHTSSLPTGARDATNLFTSQSEGDVLLSWENEALLAANSGSGHDRFEVITPSSSILCEPPVALLDKNVDEHGTREASQAYLEFLFTDIAQEIGAKNWYRPSSDIVRQKYAAQFPGVNLFSIKDLFGDGGWNTAQKTHFDTGGVFEQIYQK